MCWHVISVTHYLYIYTLLPPKAGMDASPLMGLWGSLRVHPFLLLLDLGIIDVVVVVHELVDGAFGRKLDDAVGDRLDKLMVVAGEDDVALKLNQVVVESLDGLQVQVVGGRVEDEAVGVLELHTGYHAAHLLAAGEYVHLLLHLLLLEEHPSEVALHRHLVASTILAEPLHEVQVAVEERRVVEWEVGGGDGDAPLIGAGVSLAVAVDNLKECRHRLGVMAEEHRLLPFLDIEVHMVKQYRTVRVHCLQVMDLKDLVAWLPFHLEDDARIFAARRADFLHGELLQHLLARRGLLALGDIGRETADKLLQLLALLLGFEALVLCLAQRQLRTLVPEGVVTGKDGHLAKVDIHRLCGDGIEEMSVVAHHEDGLFQVAQVLL